jgi:hypothetical protein
MRSRRNGTVTKRDRAIGLSLDVSRCRFGKDRDTIKIGRREGRFKAIRLKARGNDVEIQDLKVIHVGGDAPTISVSGPT